MTPLPPDRIVMMEDHHEALAAWRGRGLRGRTLIHVDAHMDFAWVPEIDMDEIGAAAASLPAAPDAPLINPFVRSRHRMVDIGNYICPAMREGIVDAFYWVVPDGSWRSPRGRRFIAQSVERQLRRGGRRAGRFSVDGKRGRCRIFGKEVVVCGLADLPPVEEPALLDIDVDFLLTERVWDDLEPRRLPWIGPGELVRRLAAKVSAPECATISYSVRGGFTPLRFRYLGDDLRAHLAGGRSGAAREVERFKREAVRLESGGDSDGAAALYRKALGLDVEDASLHFNLVQLLLAGSRPDIPQAARYYREAAALDRVYGTLYNNYGILYLHDRRPKEARVAYRRFLEVDPDNVATLNGLGHAALALRRHREALGYFERCLRREPGHPDARFGAAIASFAVGSMAGAEELFAGLGREYPDDDLAAWWLGRIAEERGDADAAIRRYRDAVLRGGDGPAVHARLARLYLRQGMWFRAREELGRMVQLIRSSSL